MLAKMLTASAISVEDKTKNVGSKQTVVIGIVQELLNTPLTVPETVDHTEGLQACRIKVK